MKRKYMLTGLLLLFLVQVFLYVDSLSARRAISESQKAYEALADIRAAQAEETRRRNPTSGDAQALPEKAPASGPVFETSPFAEYYGINPDFTGWLTIEKTKVDYPVARGMDNTYYLEHSFKGRRSELGSIFMDYRNVGMGIDAHTVLYGHDTESGYMFGDLDRYLSRRYLDAHPEIIFADAYAERRYRIFSVHVSPAEGALIRVDFRGKEYGRYLTMLKEKSVHALDGPVSETDRILTLVTCNYGVRDGRLFVHAVEVKAEE